jgi:hypothetical protein
VRELGGSVERKIYLSVEALCEQKKLKPWRIYALLRKGEIPVRHIAGKPVIPYLIDLVEFEKLESTAKPVKRRRRSLKIDSVCFSHRKEDLWQK